MKKYYDEKTYPNKSYLELINLVSENTNVILDVGCGEGANIALLKNIKKILSE